MNKLNLKPKELWWTKDKKIDSYLDKVFRAANFHWFALEKLSISGIDLDCATEQLWAILEGYTDQPERL